MIRRARCPLCGASAQAEMLVGGSRRHYTCGTCSEFQITTYAEHLLRKQASAGSDGKTTPHGGALSYRAATPGFGYTLVITVDGDQVVGKPMKTAELPQ